MKRKYITQELMDTIATYMNDEIRERVHSELAPCDHKTFLIRYCELDENFINVLDGEFSIDLDDVTCKVDFETLKTMDREDGEKLLISLGYGEADNGSSESNISDWAEDIYFKLYDDDDEEIDCVSWATYGNDINIAEGDFEIIKECWEQV